MRLLLVDDLLPDRTLDGTPEYVALRAFAGETRFAPLRKNLFQYAAVFNADLPKYVTAQKTSNVEGEQSEDEDVAVQDRPTFEAIKSEQQELCEKTLSTQSLSPLKP